MRGLIFAVLLMFPNFAQGADWEEVCYEDFDVCVRFLNGSYGELRSITITDSDYAKLDTSVLSEFSFLGIRFNIISNDQYQRDKPRYASSSKNLLREVGPLAGISDEAWAIYMDSSACVGGIISCYAAVGGAPATWGASLLLARGLCFTLASSCVSVIRSYYKWTEYQQRQMEKAEAEMSGGPTGIGPGTEVGGNSSGSSGSGGGVGMVWKCRPTSVTVVEAGEESTDSSQACSWVPAIQ